MGGAVLIPVPPTSPRNKRMREIRALDWSEWGGVPDCPCGYLNAFHPVA